MLQFFLRVHIYANRGPLARMNIYNNHILWFYAIAASKQHICYVGSEVLTASVMKSTIFWDITPCSRLKCSACHLLSRWFLARLILPPWRWKRYVPPKRRLTRRYIPKDSTLQQVVRSKNWKECNEIVVWPNLWPEDGCRSVSASARILVAVMIPVCILPRLHK
jgi:hypothetical protein